MPKKTKQDLIQQIDPVLQVKAWITAGQPLEDMLAGIATHFPRQDATELLTAAGELLAADYADIPIDAARGMVLNAYRDIYCQAMKIGDFGNALAAMKAYEKSLPS